MPDEQQDMVADSTLRQGAGDTLEMPKALEGIPAPVGIPAEDIARHLLYFSTCNCTYAGTRTLSDKIGLTIAKLMRVKTPLAGDFACVTALAPFKIEEAALMAAERGVLAPLVIKLAHMGFEQPPLVHQIIDPLTSTNAIFATMVHESGSSFARICRKTRLGNRASSLFVQFYSRTANEVLLTWGRGCELRRPAHWDILTNRQASLRQLWDLHEGRIESRNIVPMTLGNLVGICEEIQGGLIAEQLHAGVLRPLTPHEQARVIAALGRGSAPGSNAKHAEVLIEIARLQSGESGGWRSSIMLLVLSLLAFVVIGFSQNHWTFRTIGGLVAVLLFHEAGHYLAMRMSGYRNVKMFFIPFLGAAVSGQGFRVPTWTKVLVSLAGPVPGIILGVFLTIVALGAPSHALFSLALMLLVLNGMNLLPILPLDGGRVIGQLLLPRSPIFAIVFRAIAVICLVSAGLGLHQTVLIVLGVLIASGIPLAYRLSKLASELRRQGLAELSKNDVSAMIPDAIAEPIIERIKQMNPQGINVRLTAKQTLDVAESLMIEPASWPATVALLAAQVCAMVVAAVFAAIAVIGMHGRLSASHAFIQREREHVQIQLEHQNLSSISPEKRML